MKKICFLPLLMALIMFPQIVETIYSPALPEIAMGFAVSEVQASQTLSWYFLAFAIGVVAWGYICDIWGRRPAALFALCLYAIACFVACYAQNFTVLLFSRLLMAFAAAIGSIGSQTMMRDVLSQKELTRVFAITGIALAMSPIIGLMSGTILVKIGSYQAIFWALAIMAMVLLLCCILLLPETRPLQYQRPLFWKTARQMSQDKHIIHTTMLIALFNIALFAYYQLAPFLVEHLAQNSTLFGYSGFLMGLGALMGAGLNRYWLKQNWQHQKIILFAAILALLSAICLWLFQHTLLFVLPMVGVVMAYSLAIPNILANALKDYRAQIGTAGAILGLFYYAVIGLGLILVGQNQNLGMCLSLISGLLLLLTLFNRQQST